MAEIKIRKATIDDATVIAKFNEFLALETENKALDPAIIRAGVEALLNQPELGQYWLATAGETVVGQLALTFEWSDWRNGQLLWIQSVYVAKAWRRAGIFSALYRHVVSLAPEQSGAVGIRLYVEKENQQAQETYRSMGMAHTNYIVMQQLLEGKNSQC